MGNVLAAGPTQPPAPPLVPPPPQPSKPVSQGGPPPSADQLPQESVEDTGPGSFEDLHRKCKDIFPAAFEGGKVVVQKGLSNHFQISHTLTMSMLQPSGYKFGATYVGTHKISPVEMFPVMIGDIDASGNLNANIIHQFNKAIRCKFAAQIQNSKWQAAQLTTDYKGSDCTASVTLGNPDLIGGSGVVVAQYLQNVTNRLAMGAELLYQYGGQVPGGQMGIYTLAGRYSADAWQLSGNLTPMAGGAHLCYYHKASKNTQIGVELEGSLRMGECTTTLGYQIDLPQADMLFRGQLDTNYTVGAYLEKKLLPLPFTLALSAHLNHVKNSYRFGMALIVG